MKPVYIQYSTAIDVFFNYGYVVRIEEGKLFLCSNLTYRMAKKLKRAEKLFTIDTRSIIKDYSVYSAVNESEVFRDAIPDIIRNNELDFLNIVSSNFHYISRICDFIEEFTEYGCKRDFVGCCISAWETNERYFSNELLSTLFQFVFNSYSEITSDNYLRLLLEERISEFVLEWNENDSLRKTKKENNS